MASQDNHHKDPLDLEIIEKQLAQLDLELTQEEITRKGYEKKKAQLLSLLRDQGNKSEVAIHAKSHLADQRQERDGSASDSSFGETNRVNVRFNSQGSIPNANKSSIRPYFAFPPPVSYAPIAPGVLAPRGPFLHMPHVYPPVHYGPPPVFLQPYFTGNGHPDQAFVHSAPRPLYLPRPPVVRYPLGVSSIPPHLDNTSSYHPLQSPATLSKQANHIPSSNSQESITENTQFDVSRRGSAESSSSSLESGKPPRPRTLSGNSVTYVPIEPEMKPFATDRTTMISPQMSPQFLPSPGGSPVPISSPSSQNPSYQQSSSKMGPRDSASSLFDVSPSLSDHDSIQALPTPRKDRDLKLDLESLTQLQNSDLFTIGRILRQRARENPTDNTAHFCVLDTKGKSISSISYSKLYLRALKVAQTLKDRSTNLRQPVALVFRQEETIDYLVSLFGCFYAGSPAVPIVPSSVHVEDEIFEILFIFDACKVQSALSTDTTIKHLNKVFSSHGKHLPKVQWFKSNELGVYQPPGKSSFLSSKSSVIEEPDWLNLISRDSASLAAACIEYTKNLSGDLKAVVITHEMIIRNVMLIQDEVQSHVQGGILNMLESRLSSGLLFTFHGILCNQPVYFLLENTVYVPGAWPSVVSKYKPSLVVMEESTGFHLAATHKDFTHLPARKGTVIDLSSLTGLLIPSLVPYKKFGPLLEATFSSIGFPTGIVRPLFALAEFAFALTTHVPKNANADDILGLFIDSEALCDGKVVVKRAYLEGETDITIVPDDSTFVVDVGAICEEVSVAIVDSATGALLPSDRIGEVWISAAHLPKALWSLPKLTEKVLHAHPALYLTGDNQPPGEFPFSVLPQSRPGPRLGTCLITYDYVRTGLYGFIVSRDQVPHLQENERRLVVVGHSKDRLSFKNDQIASVPDGHKARMKSKTYFSNLVMESIFEKVPGLIACVLFSQSVSAETLGVAIFETERTDFPFLASSIRMVLKEKHGILPYAIAFCAPKSFPRLDASSPSTTFISSSSHHYASLELFETPPAPPALVLDQNARGHLLVPPLDNSTISGLWNQGSLPIRYCSLNGSDLVVGRLLSPSISTETRPTTPPATAAQVVGGMTDIPILDDHTKHDLRDFGTIIDLFLWRADIASASPSLTILDARCREAKTITFGKLSQKAYSVAQLLLEKHKLMAGDYVIVMFSPSLEYYYCMWACFYLGIIPIPMQAPDTNRLREDLPSLLKIVQEFSVKAILVNTAVEEELRSRNVQSVLKSLSQATSSPAPSPTFPTIVNTTKGGKASKMLSKTDPLFCKGVEPHYIALVWISFCPDATRTAVKVSHQALLEQCRIQAIAGKMVLSTVPGIDGNTRLPSVPPTSRPFLACLKEQSGLEFLYSTLMGVYIGSCTYVLPFFEYFVNPALLFDAIDRFRVKDAIVSHSMLGHALKFMENGDFQSFSLHNLECLLIPSNGRIRYEFYKSVMRTLIPNRLSDNSIATTYGTHINPFVATRGYTNLEPTILWIDTDFLSLGKLKVLREARGEHRILAEEQTLTGNFVRLQESGKIPNNTIVAIVDPTTRKLCRPDQIGEIWVCSPGNIDGFSSDISDELLSCKVEGVDPLLRFARTRDRGFLWPVPANGIEMQAMMLGAQSTPSGWTGLVLQGLPYEMVLFVIGSTEHEILVNGRSHFCEDVELTIERSHPSLIPSSCIVFQTDSGKVIAVIETQAPCSMPNAFYGIITNVLCAHHLLIDTICFLQVGMCAKSRLNEKQRRRVAAAYRLNKLPVIETFHVVRNETHDT